MTDSSKYALYQELIKVVGPGLYEENDIIADYFANTSSDGPYLIAEKYISFIANGFSVNVIDAPEGMSSILNNNERIENALTDINEAAEIHIFDFDECTITVQDKNNLTIYEKQAILSCYTANVTFNSFAAEVEFHADMVGCLNFAGTDDTLTDISILIPISAGEIFTFLLTLTPSEVRDMYEAAVRADMGISEEDESGYFDYYYKLNSDIVQNQAQIHGEY